MKPFKAPTIVARTPSNGLRPSTQLGEPPAKKRRISSHDSWDDDIGTIAAAANVLKSSQTASTIKKFQAPVLRKPLDVIQNPSSSQIGGSSEGGHEGYYTVLWRKFTAKKNKTWDGDGVLSTAGGYATLQDVSGRDLGRASCKGPLLVGSELSIGHREIEVESMISKQDFLAGRPFLGGVRPPPPPPSLKEADEVSRTSDKAQAKHVRLAQKQKESLSVAIPSSKGTGAGFKTPVLGGSHNSGAEGALIMRRPTSVPKGKQIVDVVVDPLIGRKLRQHQRKGVSFLYECVMGMKGYEGDGAILADEMGLGKTLQTIALLWTLMKQNPIYGSPPVVRKALIVCPVTLINNWRKEFYKWLGKERIGVFTPEDRKSRMTDFTKGRVYNVMIIGYERLQRVQAELQQTDCIDIIIADEGHRMKKAQNKAALAIKSLSTSRRVILSGTPIQNDLGEFHTMVDFVNPGLLSKYTTFKKEFEGPIVTSQQPGASAKDVEKGEARSAELAEITSMFILRRTAEILSRYLPQKTEYVVFCRPTSAQASAYRDIIGSPTFNAAMGTSAMALELIMVLKKVCNDPRLLLKKGEKGEDTTRAGLLEGVSRSLLKTPGASGKLQVLDSLLHTIRTTTDDKVVLVSNYTSTMDILANLMNSLSYKYLRLDGSTPANKRQELVDRFNRSPVSNSFVFLLSAKAGGVGLNLIGASRLVLFDLDWNPATDLQAMARVHRDGQKKPCFIYRLLTQGAIDEKIFQRQVMKTGLADTIVDGKSGVSGFTREELRDLFTLDEDEGCQTHKLLGCQCGGQGAIAPLPAPDLFDPRNDLATLSAPDKDGFVELEPDYEIVDLMGYDSDGDAIYKKKTNFKTGNQVDWKTQEAEIERKKRECHDSAGKAKMLSLMQYAHFDTSLIQRKPKTQVEVKAEEGRDVDSDTTMEDELVDASEVDPLEIAIEDDVLKSVLREDGRKVGFVFSKSST
ncbi:SNF2 family DNA-dependent ATPase domain-containing protein [Teratosphaeria nubilosa]|uniref:SNF2 family DNA-dependent ATPase domain-containing protein n=1 Tax=Teratosphaeria nubilosa TaxID=161662 RepID=A0A6G1L9A2_9PEZI|nr:SNF2 family DNA-dependent ATPase domain-containing protein [Teratosphaeria nubilosa]